MTRQEEFDSLLDLLIDGEFSPIEDWIEERQPDHGKWIEMLKAWGRKWRDRYEWDLKRLDESSEFETGEDLKGLFKQSRNNSLRLKTLLNALEGKFPQTNQRN